MSLSRLPDWLVSRMASKKPLLNDSEKRDMLARFDRLLNRISKARAGTRHCYPERIEIIKALLRLDPGEMLIHCLYACTQVDQQEERAANGVFYNAIRELHSRPKEEDVSISNEELEQCLAQYEREFGDAVQ